MRCEVTVIAEGVAKKWFRTLEAKNACEAAGLAIRLPEVAIFFAERPYAAMCVHAKPADAEEVRQAA